MPFYRIGGHMVHVRFSGKARRNPPPPCCARVPSIAGGNAEVRCGGLGAFLCDWPVDGGTCSAPLCDEHAIETGRDRHYCPLHAAQHREREPELF